MTEQFETPAPPSSGVDFNTLLGALLLIKVISHEEHVPNVFTQPGQKTPAARTDITVIDGAHAGEEFIDVLVFPRVLRSQLTRSVGKTVLGRLRQGEAKQGQNPPWMLEAANEQDIAAARQYMARKAQPTISQAAPPF